VPHRRSAVGTRFEVGDTPLDTATRMNSSKRYENIDGEPVTGGQACQRRADERNEANGLRIVDGALTVERAKIETILRRRSAERTRMKKAVSQASKSGSGGPERTPAAVTWPLFAALARYGRLRTFFCERYKALPLQQPL